MRPIFVPSLIAFAIISSCGPERNGRDNCTLEAVGDETGSEIISVNLLIPEYHMTGAEISNGGIHVIDPDCDFTLNSILSDETADYLIEQAQHFRMVHTPSGSKVAEAELYIWRFRDSSEKPRFFVESVMSLSEPETLPTFSDAEHFRQLDNVR